MTSMKGPRTKMVPTNATNVGAPSGNSQPAPPEQVGVENSTAESHSEVYTSKASQRVLDGANPQSSNGIDKTTNAQKELHTAGDERTKMNTADVDTPSLSKNPDSLKTQSTNGNMDVAPQGSRLSTSMTCFSVSHRSEEVEASTVSDQLPIDTGHSDHASGEVMDQNEKSSKSCEDASTSSIKENTEVNQLPQNEEPRDTKGANKQKASGIAQAEDGQTTTPSMEEDMNQQMTKYEGDIRGLKAKILSMETFASQKERGYTEKIERLETKISSLEKIVDQQQEKDNEKDVESFKARISDMETWIFRTEHGVNMEHKKEMERLEGKHEKDIERLEGKHEKEVERLEEKHEKEVERLEAKYEKEIERLEAKHEKEIERLEGKHEKEIQRLEVIERLQTKLSAEEETKQPKKKEVKDPKSPGEKSVPKAD